MGGRVGAGTSGWCEEEKREEYIITQNREMMSLADQFRLQNNIHSDGGSVAYLYLTVMATSLTCFFHDQSEKKKTPQE